jgi:phage tail-like protein
MPQPRDDPYLNFNFRVEIDGVTIAGFSEADLPAGRIEAVAYRDGTDKSSAARLLPGRVEWGPVVLRRGFTGDPALFQWWSDVLQGDVTRRDVLIVLLDEQRKDVARWVVRDAWPQKWDGPDFRGLGNDVVIETLELAHEGVELDD